MSEPLLSVQDLCVEYFTPAGSVRAVDRVSFDIARGEVFGLAGESGCGKSTIAQAILRILQPPAAITGGSVRFEGSDVLELDDAGLRAFRWRKLSLVFQSAMNALNPVLSVGEQIADVILAHEPVSKAEAWQRAEGLLELVGIDKARVRSFPHQLSGGMRQRVVIAIALALHPPFIIMDEPTTALDVVVQKEILQKIAELKDKLGFSILFITHDLSLMLELCDRVGILYAGRVAEIGASRELLESPRHPYTKGLMASFPSVHGEREKLTGIAGSPPDMRRPPPGCRFHPRCGEALARCSEEQPELVDLGGRRAACHLHPAPGAAAREAAS